ncbi:MAG: mechanosensitive ion channel [Bacteroidales bacterium]|nr:mechanosensitive ion channel [Bacteroidales bacterium]
MTKDIINNIVEWLISVGVSENITILFKTFIFAAIIAFLSFLVFYITKKVLIKIVTKIIKKTKNEWDDAFLKNDIFKRLSHFAPALVIYYGANFAFSDYPLIIPIVKSTAYIYMIIMGLLVLDAFLNTLHDIYQFLPFSKNRPIKGYMQVIKIVLYLIGFILILSIILGKSPIYFFTGLGAFAAVLILVFKDTILGFIASIQLSANKMVNIGDWISMPSHKADGTVLEITLNTVKVQNWDKTISTIPTYALVSESFNNWRGMEESGGRRIKRSINIDMKSIKFCTPEMISKFKKIQFLTDYLNFMEKELTEYNQKNNIDNSVLVNGRRLTNIGVFRKYVEEYLKHHPKIHNNMTFLVRQLQLNEKGLPIEIYVFSNDQEWANYESIQSDIFDHILAILPEFNLNVFQNPTGNDFQKLIN